ncbi:MAG: hypothetical protein M3O70_24325 [Actinomycetota bacterium]|nr:hypothetical protein [Actinomycetota bacterium]
MELNPGVVIAMVVAAGLWVIGVPLVFYWLSTTGRLARSRAWHLRDPEDRPAPGWLQWVVAGGAAYTLAYVGFGAVGVVLQALGVNVRHPLVTVIVVPLFLLTIVGLARSIRRKMPLWF